MTNETKREDSPRAGRGLSDAPSGHEDASEIAGKLTKARRAMVLALPADGGWGCVPSRSVAKRAWWSMIPGLIDHKHYPDDANEWALTPLGISVRAVLVGREA